MFLKASLILINSLKVFTDLNNKINMIENNYNRC